MANNSHYDKVFTEAVFERSYALNACKVKQHMQEINEELLIDRLEKIGNNEHLIKSIKEKGLPKTVFCSEDMLMFCALIFNFCKIQLHQLLDPGSVLLSWIDIDEYFPKITSCDSLIPGTFINM